jgi:glycosyltransferase involved in cell wall biosynthesis/peptidoglycan/xylan/chitin deacetylase (PgdA/CDA1 family)
MKHQDVLITVILPCYNAMPFLTEALESMINQTYWNLEIICLNDGSTDKTATVLEQYAKKDSRVRVVHNESNLGLIRTLNKGIELARGEYISRMDADDISMPDRIEKQLTFIRSTKADIISSGVVIINDQGKSLEKLYPRALSTLEIAYLSLFVNPMLHPTVFAKSEVLKKHHYLFNDISLHVEDFELWTRLIRNNVILLNHNDIVLYYRISTNGISRKYSTLQNSNFSKMVLFHIKYYAGIPVSEDCASILSNRFNNVDISLMKIKEAFIIMNRLEKWFVKRYNLKSSENKSIKRTTELQKIDILIQLIKKSKIKFNILSFMRFRFLYYLFFDFKTQRHLWQKVYSKRKIIEKTKKTLETSNIEKPTSIQDFKRLTYSAIKKTGLHTAIHPFIKKTTVLCFHSVCDMKGQLIYPSMPVKTFSRVLEYISMKFQVCNFDEVISSGFISKKPKCIITFDDGYLDFMLNALPIIHKYQFPVYQSIITKVADKGKFFWTQQFNVLLDQLYREQKKGSFRLNDIVFSFDSQNTFLRNSNELFLEVLKMNDLNRKSVIDKLESFISNSSFEYPRMMQWADIVECMKNDVRIFSHTNNHFSLIAENDVTVLNSEIFDSASEICKNTGVNPEGFTFPNGQFNKRIIDMVSEKYKYLLTTSSERFNPNLRNNSTSYIIPRITLNAQTFEENIVRLFNIHKFFS